MDTIEPVGGDSVKLEDLRIGKMCLYFEPLSAYTGKMRLVTVKGFVGGKVWIQSPYVGTQLASVEQLRELK